ncbi:MAG TPA: hypothetical protein VGL98_06165 [Gammaproteobacteria bacterium]
MAAGMRNISVRITGDASGLDRAAKAADASIDKFASNATKTVGKAAAGIPSILTNAISSMPPMGSMVAGVIVAGLAVALAPMLAAALTAGILAAVGGGVLALGIKSAIDNPKVAEAFDGLKKKASKVFEDFGKPFEAPLIRAAGTFEGVLGRLEPHIERLGALIAPVIDKLAPALGEFLERVMPGIESAVAASVPLFNTLAEKLPAIGTAISDFFMMISANGDDANLFFSDLLDWLTATIRSLGWIISKLAAMYGAVREFVSNASKKFSEWKNWVVQKGREVADWFRALPDRVGSALSSIKNRIIAPFRSAFNAIVRLWNGTVGGLSFSIPGWVPGIGGNSFSVPRLSERASGGPVLAGRSYLVGERGPEVITMGSTNGNVIPNRELGSGGGDVYEIHVDLAHAVKEVIRFEHRDLKRRATARGAFA